MGKSDSLKSGINRADLSGPKSKQYRIRQTAHHFIAVLRHANMGGQKWTKVTNKHFQRLGAFLRDDRSLVGRISLHVVLEHLSRVSRVVSRNSANKNR